MLDTKRAQQLSRQLSRSNHTGVNMTTNRRRMSELEYDTCSNNDLHRLARLPCTLFSEADQSPRIMITGGAGFVGSHLIDALKLRSKGSVKVIDNLWRGRLENLCNDDNMKAVPSDKCGCSIDLHRDLCFADLSNASQIDTLFEGADVVYHLADVVAGIGYVFEHQQFLFRQNVLINCNVLQACKLAKSVKDYIYVGTACSFPLELQSDYTYTALHEDQTYPAHPESAYGWSKLMGEYEAQLVTSSQQRSLNIGLLRFHNLYGPRSQYADPTQSQALPALIRKALNYPGEEYKIWGSGKQYRDFLYISDAVDALLAMHEHGMNQGVIQVGTGTPCTIMSAAKIVQTLTKKCFGKELEMVVDKSKREGDLGRVAVIDRAEQIMGWRPKVNIHEGLSRMYLWILRDAISRQTFLSANNNTGGFISQEEQCLVHHARAASSQGALSEVAGVQIPQGTVTWRPPPSSLLRQIGPFNCKHAGPTNATDGVLAIVIASTRGHHLTWNNFDQFLLKPLKADLALAVGRNTKDAEHDSFRANAAYIWELDEPPRIAYDPPRAVQVPNYRHYYDEIAQQCFKSRFTAADATAVGQAFMRQWLGLIAETGHPAGSGMLQFYRWVALQRMMALGLLAKYRSVIITRSDFFFVAPHPPVSDLQPGQIYVPEGEDYGGITDRHIVMHAKDAPRILSMAENLVNGKDSTETITRMKRLDMPNCRKSCNLERVLLRWFSYLNLKISRFPAVAFTVSDPDDSAVQRWGMSGHRTWTPMLLEAKYHKEVSHSAKAAQQARDTGWSHTQGKVYKASHNVSLEFWIAENTEFWNSSRFNMEWAAAWMDYTKLPFSGRVPKDAANAKSESSSKQP